MKSRIIPAALVLALVAATSGCGGGGGGATPQATFDTFKSAMQSKDYKKGFSQLTPDSQDVMVGAMSMMAGLFSITDPQKGPEAQKILDKHGVKKLDPTAMASNPGDPSAALNAMKATTADVKDKPACIAEIMEWMEKNAPPGQKNANTAEEFAAAELVDVKVEGDSAHGTLKMKKDGQESTQPADFKKVGGVWLIDFTKSMGPANAGAPPAP